MSACNGGSNVELMYKYILFLTLHQLEAEVYIYTLFKPTST